jgi:large subunit ribosomal protein L6e
MWNLPQLSCQQQKMKCKTDAIPQKKQPTSDRASDQKSIDKPILAAIKNEEFLASYLSSSFSLRHGQRPHEMKF